MRESEFEKLFTAFSDRVFGFFMVKTGGDRETAKDLTQETFTKVWKARGRIDRDKKFESLLFTIAARTFIDHLRTRKLSFPLEAAHEKVAEQSPDRLVISEVLDYINEFPEEMRDVILLSYFSGLSHDEVARQMGKSAAAVRMVKMRALKKLRSIFAEG